MKPITDDVVHSLLQGIAAREKSRGTHRRRRSSPAKIIKFTGSAVKKGEIAVATNGTRRTISGVFCYVSRFGRA